MGDSHPTRQNHFRSEPVLVIVIPTSTTAASPRYAFPSVSLPLPSSLSTVVTQKSRVTGHASLPPLLDHQIERIAYEPCLLPLLVHPVDQIVIAPVEHLGFLVHEVPRLVGIVVHVVQLDGLE